jgi:hypothetical protein
MGGRTMGKGEDARRAAADGPIYFDRKARVQAMPTARGFRVVPTALSIYGAKAVTKSVRGIISKYLVA